MNTIPPPAMGLLRRSPLPALLAFSLLITVPALRATTELPIEVFTPNGTTAQKDVVVTVSGAPAAQVLFLEMHNLRYGGQASVQVNNDPWIDLYNHTVRVREKDRKYGGIGGLHGTIVMEVDLVTPVGDGSNTIRFRFNGTSGLTSGFRVLEFDFLKSDGTPVLGSGAFTYANPELWQKIYTGAADIQRGKDVFQGTASPAVNLVDNVISNRPIAAKCADCHFRDGSDLHYFNYSNEAISTRAQFHGVSLVDSEKIASYIRSLNDSPSNPNPGRPWNPPFQPGPGTDTSPAENWAAGKGLAAVHDDEVTAINEIFRPGSSDTTPITFTEIAKVLDHDNTFSVRNVGLGLQLPDWNSWLPPFHPKDVWPSGTYQFMGSTAQTAYGTLDGQVDTQAKIDALKTTGGLRDKVGDFELAVELWLRQGCDVGTTCDSSFRVFPGAPVIDARSANYTSEEAKIGLTKWLASKTFEIVQTRGLYDETLTDGLGLDPMYRGEVLSWPADEQSVFFIPPHLTSDNKLFYTWQEQNLGKTLSHQWYMVQLTVNSGMRIVTTMNTPLDWDYQFNHTTDAGDYTGDHSGIRQLLTMIKEYEVRANGNRIDPSTTTLIAQDGFAPRGTHLWRFYSDAWAWKYSYKGAFEELQPDLWRRLFEEFTYEWLDVLEKLNLSDSVHVPRVADRFHLPPSNTIASQFTGVEGDEMFPFPAQDHCINSFRILPIADEAGVDKLTLLDFALWSTKAWPSNNFVGQLNLTKLVYYDNFEDNTVAFTGYTTIAIKDANFVNNNAIAPKRGGGKYVIQLPVAGGAASTNAATISQALGGATQLRARARVAFDLSSGGNPSAPQFKMNVAVDGGAVQSGAILALDPGLMEKKFVTYEHTFTVAGTNLTKVELYWSNPNAASGTAYVDNVEVLNVTPPADSPAGPPPVPSAPVPTNTLADHILVDWNDVVAADLAGYRVYRWRTNEAETTKELLNNVLVKTSKYWDDAVQSGAEYYYKVSAVDTNGNESAQSAASSVAFYPGMANSIWAPNWITASVIQTPGTVDLRWFGAAQTWDTKGYEVQRKLHTGNTYSTISGANPVQLLTYNDATVTPGTSYDYKVRTLDLDGNNSDSGPYTRTVLGVIPINASPPVAPMGLTATPGTDRVVLSWTASTGADSYNVKRSTTNGGPYTTIAPGVIPTSYTDTTAVGGTTYYYVVSAVNVFGESANSNQASATPSSTPTFVAAGAYAAGTGTITPALPSGIAVNDILLLFIETANQAVTISNSNGGTWTQVTGSPQGTGTGGGTTATALTVFWSRYNETQGAPTASDSGNHQIGRMIAIRGAVATGDPWDVTAGGVEGTADTSASIPGATTTVANTLVVIAVAGSLPDAIGTANFSGWANANLTNLTERTDDTRNSGNGGALGIATGEKATAGAYGNTAVTHANSAVKGMISIAIRK